MNELCGKVEPCSEIIVQEEDLRTESSLSARWGEEIGGGIGIVSDDQVISEIFDYESILWEGI